MDKETQRVLEIVKRYREPRQPSGYRLHVSDTGIRHGDDWWEVVVQPSSEDIGSYDYYERLADVAGNIDDHEHLNVTLVPALHG